MMGGREAATGWIVKNADSLALLALERDLDPPRLSAVLARRKRSARELFDAVRKALPDLERNARCEAIEAGEPWPPDPPKDNGEW
jgi:hypothetical protein